MTKSYKMVLLLAMLQRGPLQWFEPITPTEAAPFFYQYFMENEVRKRKDFSDKGTKRLWDYDEAKVSREIAEMPMTKWSESSKGLIEFKDGVFSFNLEFEKSSSDAIYNWTKEICLYRLHEYFERKGMRGG